MRRELLAGFAAIAVLTLATMPVRAADYAPLNCAAAKSPAERTICGHYGLGQSEARMATLYEWSTSFVGMGQRSDMQDAQRAFLKTRDACGAKIACLRGAYEARIAQLQAVMQRVKEKGPF
jgi:uncharacterized protein